jgi:hypothetical protein
LPVHWGTFNLGLHAWNQPAEAVAAEASARGVQLVVPRPGEPVDIAAPQPVTAWWR